MWSGTNTPSSPSASARMVSDSASAIVSCQIGSTTPYFMSPSTRAWRASAPDRQPGEIQLGHAPEHEVGDDARRAARHRPAHVPVAAVEEEVAVSAESEDRWPIGRHRAQARTVLAAVVVGGIGKEVAREAQDIVEVARRPAPVVAGELRRRRQPQPIAEPRPADEPLLVDAGDRRREPTRFEREGRGVAL